MKKSDNKDFLLNLNLFSRSKNELLTSLREHLTRHDHQTSSLRTIFTPNSEQFVQATHDPRFAKALGFADILLPDGAGLVWGYRILAVFGRSKAPQIRITGIDVVQDLLEVCGQEQRKVLIIGGRELDAYTQALAERGLAIRWLEGYERASVTTQAEEQALTREITAWQPEVVFVALGAPLQEFWVVEHAPLLARAGVRVAMVVGGAFDVLSGKIRRAPSWMRAINLEWLYRLIVEPWRWRRQLRLIEFMFLIGKRSLLG